MNKCRNCGTEVSLEELYCPVCGIAHPVKAKLQKTVDLTTIVDPIDPDYELDDPKSRKVTFLLFALVGWTGAGFFYLKKNTRGVIWAIVNIVAIIGLTLLGAFNDLGLPWWQLFLIVFGAFILINLVIGLYYLLADDVKDGYDQFLE